MCRISDLSGLLEVHNDNRSGRGAPGRGWRGTTSRLTVIQTKVPHHAGKRNLENLLSQKFSFILPQYSSLQFYHLTMLHARLTKILFPLQKALLKKTVSVLEFMFTTKPKSGVMYKLILNNIWLENSKEEQAKGGLFWQHRGCVCAVHICVIGLVPGGWRKIVA